MAKRQRNLGEKLGGEEATGKLPAGWRDQMKAGAGVAAGSVRADSPAASEAGEPFKRKTYLVTDALEARIRDLAKRESVGQNELVRYLLAYALEQIAAGAHTLPTQPVMKKRIRV